MNLKWVSFIFISFAAQAEEVPMKSWNHEAEVSVVSVTGNSESDSVSARQKTSYQQDQNTYTLAGRFLNTKSLDRVTQTTVDTARLWEASLRYDRALTVNWSAYLGTSSEASPFSGYIQKDNAEFGGKYIFIKDTWTGELGYRNTKTYDTKGVKSTTPYGRVFTEYTQAITATSTFRASVEYLPNLTDRNGDVVTIEPSLSAILSSVFSLKIAYSWKNNAANLDPIKKTDTQFTTALVAKF